MIQHFRTHTHTSSTATPSHSILFLIFRIVISKSNKLFVLTLLLENIFQYTQKCNLFFRHSFHTRMRKFCGIGIKKNIKKFIIKGSQKSKSNTENFIHLFVSEIVLNSSLTFHFLKKRFTEASCCVCLFESFLKCTYHVLTFYFIDLFI